LQPTVRPIHTRVQGRVRYRIEGLQRSEALKDYLCAHIPVNDEIIHFSANTVTGNVLIRFDRHDHSLRGVSGLLAGLVAEYAANAVGATPGGNSSRNRRLSPNVEAKGKGHKPSTKRLLRKLVVHAEGQKSLNWHVMTADDIAAALDTSTEYGLSSESAKKALARYGPNVLPESVPRSGFSIFIDQFKSLPVIMLGIAAAISVLTGGFADAVVVIAVVAINATIGYVTENQSEKTIHSLKRLVRPTAEIVRDGTLREIGADEVVPGDILALKPGVYVAADARLLAVRHLSVDESTLTGESMPVMKTVTPLSGDHIPIGERTNTVYMGTLVTGGQGLAVVVSSGRFTEIGKIQTMVGEARAPETPMSRQLDKMGRQLVWICSAVCAGVFGIGLLRGYGFLQMLTASISLAVAAVPEGLPTVSTTTLTLGIRKMRQLNVLIRHLEAVETLGAVRTICLDKTGTLTRNSMSVRALFAGKKRCTVSEGKFLAAEGPVDPYSLRELLTLLHVSVLCNESEVATGKRGKFVVNGSSTENALIHTALGAGVDVLQVRQMHPTISVNHRSENRNCMYTIHNGADNGARLVALKGSPDEVISLCNLHMENGVVLPLSDEDRLDVEIQNEQLAGEALRVLGLAYCMVDGDRPPIAGTADFKDDLIWLGLVGMADPIRDGMRDVIKQFHGAGIDTVMITGDQSATAYVVGKELNLSKTDQLEILDSTQFAGISPEALKGLTEQVHVFSRVSPAHKLQIVQALQSAGKVVAMTGDGINDGPALKAADIGIAMGHTGTDVAREVADVILEDDNLETMIVAISQGRTIYNNTRKAVHYLISTNLSEIMVMTLGIGLGMGQPLNGMQLLWINLISDIFPGLALALEPPEPDVLSYPPRDPDEPIVKPSDFKRIAAEAGILSVGTIGAYGYGVMRYGISPAAGTIAFTTLCTGQILRALSCRSEIHSMFDRAKMPPNRKLDIVVAGTLALQALTFVIPPLRGLLGLTPITVIDGTVIAGGALIPLLVNEASKMTPRLQPSPSNTLFPPPR
jgi:Ca2+-transporting ATPase